jgi:hypothetical protein
MTVVIEGSAGITTNSGAVYNSIQRGTVNAGGTNPFPSSSGPATVDFTGIPSWVERITVMFNEVSTNGTSNWLIQLGDSGGIETTGYICVGTYLGALTTGTNFTAGFGLLFGTAGHVAQGTVVLTNLNTNIWTVDGGLAGSGAAAGYIYSTSGSKTLSSTLDRVRITTVNGTDLFDAGSINILYE